MKNIKEMIKNRHRLLNFIAVFATIIVFLSCANSADPDRTDDDEVANNFIVNVSITGLDVFANACDEIVAQIDSEALPPGTFVDVELVPGFKTIEACLLDNSVAINSEGRAFLEFVTGYFEGPNETASFRIKITFELPNGQTNTHFADVQIAGIGIIPPMGELDGAFVIQIPEDMMTIEGLSLFFQTVGIKPGTVASISVNPALGFVTDDMPVVSGEVSDGFFVVDYFANFATGTQLLVAEITLETPPEILAIPNCNIPSEFVLTATVTIIQTGGGVTGLESETGFCGDFIDNDGDMDIDCADSDCEGEVCLDAPMGMVGTCDMGMCDVGP